MNNEEILDFVEAAEERFDVGRLRIGGMRVWPLVRYEVCTRNHYLSAEQRTGQTGEAPPRPREKGRLAQLRETTRAWLDARSGDRAHRDRLHRADVVLYSDGLSFVELGGKHYEKFCDPIAEGAHARGLSTLMLTPAPNGRYLVPRASPSVFVQPLVDAALLASAARTKLTPGLPQGSDLDGYEDVVAFMTERAGGKLLVADRDRLRRVASHVRTWADAYKALLRVARPRAVFIVCWYGGERMAMCLAARELGIPSVDLQHGVEGPAHFAYARWRRVPRAGYELLPRFFWCWEASDVRTIEEWSAPVADVHRPLLGGNVYLARWREGGIVSERDAAVAAIHERARGKKHVLYTASGLETDAQIAELAAAVRASADRHFWWLRMHPMRKEVAARFEAALRGQPGWNVREATDAPLFAVLRRMDAHVTETSSTVVEATMLGIPSVLCRLGEAALFPDQVARGWAIAVATTAEVPAAIDRQIARAGELRKDRAAAAEEPDPKAALDAILALHG